MPSQGGVGVGERGVPQVEVAGGGPSLRLLDYLVALARQLSGRQRRRLSEYDPPLILPADVPDSPAVTLGGSSGDASWLRVRKVADPRPPVLPATLAPWLAGVPIGVTTPPPLPEDLDDRCARAGEDPQALRARHADWVEQRWRPWAEPARATVAARRLYQQLFDLRLRLDRDNATHELVFGHGVLSWLAGGQAVEHPLLITRATIEMDARSGVLTVVPDGVASLETAPLDDLGLSGIGELTALRDRLRASPPDPWSAQDRADLYAEAVAPLGLDAVVLAGGVLSGGDVLSGGNVVGGGEDLGAAVPPDDPIPRPTERAVLVDTWALFVRPRPAMFPRFYAELREVLAERAHLPDAFAAVADARLAVDDDARADGTITGDRATSVHARGGGGGGGGGGSGSDGGPGGSAAARGVVGDLLGERLLLPLASNAEQERIAVQLGRASGVTVQGPPGTGKSHTIANLVSHLVAHGQRVLVTAHNEQALTVVRDKIPEQLRDLSVAVLGASSASLTQLHASVQMIMESVAVVDVRAERAALAGLVRELDAARVEQRQLEYRLLDLLADEAAEFPLPDGRARAAQVADWLARHEADLGRIPDALREDQTAPLTVAELDELLRLAGRLAGDAEQARRDLPDQARLPGTAELADRLHTLDELRDDLAELETRGVGLAGVDEVGPVALADLVAAARDAARRVEALAEPWLDRLRAQVAQSASFAALWSEQATVLETTSTEIIELRRRTLGREIVLPAGDHREQRQFLDELRTRFAAGRGLPRLGNKALRSFYGETRVDGLDLRTADDVELVQARLREQVRLAALARHCQDLVDQVGAPPLPTDPVALLPLAQERAARLRDAVSWEATDGPALVARLRALLPAIPARPTSEQLTDAATVLEAATTRGRERDLTAWFDDLLGYLDAGGRAPGASPLWATLRTAGERRDIAAWSAAIDEVARLTGLRPQLRRRDELADLLATETPLWAARIVEGGAQADVCGTALDLPRLWCWRQAQTWLSALHGRGDATVLAHRVDEAGGAVSALVEQIAARSARLGMKLNLREDQRRALMGWLQSLARIGKGTGRFARRWEHEARAQMPTAMGAVPIWIMPIHRVLQSFDPRHTDLFDVVIVDESSQCDVLSLGVLALGRKVVVVGDDRQISPAAVGVDRARVFQLIEAHLPAFGQRSLLDLEASLYDTATRVFPDVVLLREHFRCVPDIIEFSNRFYDGRILPVREERDRGIGASVRPVRVPDGVRTGGQFGDANEPEAAALVEQLLTCCRDPAYDGMTFGVVTLLGGGQGRLIEQRLLERLGSEEFERRRLRVGDAYNFQGDERDVIFLSVVADDARYAANRKLDQQRVNVAASRARDQFWIFHSVDPGALHPDDVRGQLLTYAYGLASPRQRAASLEERCESDFERRVLRDLVARGYRVRPQHQVGGFRIDLVVEGDGGRLAIECDGDRFHGPDQWEADLRRQRVLERLGWRFWRVRGSAYYRNPEQALASLWTTLDDQGIHPAGRHDGIAAAIVAP